MADAEAMRLQADALGQGLCGRLTVGCFGTGAPLVLPALMETFEQRYPGMRLTLSRVRPTCWSTRCLTAAVRSR